MNEHKPYTTPKGYVAPSLADLWKYVRDRSLSILYLQTPGLVLLLQLLNTALQAALVCPT